MSSSSGATKGAKKDEGKRTFTKPNAWSKPLQKTPVAPPPGLSLNKKAPASSNADALRERFLHLLLTMVGQKVQITLVDGAVYGGVFHTATPFNSLPADQRNKVILQAVSIVKPPTDKTATQVKAGQTLVVDMAQVVHLHLKSIRMDALTTTSNSNNTSNNAAGFQTDTEISGKNSGGSKGLVAAGTAWTTPIASPPTSGNGNNSRADALMGNAARTTPVQASGLQGSIGGWDQFKANEQLFNVKASYDENLYTTELDKSTLDKQKIEQAEKLAREIEGAASSNPHIAEERGHKIEGDYDEEDLYSGVLKEQQPKKQPMNWAAAVAKKDTGDKPKETIASSAVSGKKAEAVPSTPKVDESSMAEATPVTSNRKKEQGSDKTSEQKEEVEKPVEQAPKEDTSSETKESGKSKLNANAKSFTFNINAKTFTPGSTSGPPEGMPPTQPPPMVYDPNTGMPMAPHMYMHAPVGQPAMVHMMGHPQYGMRYPYPGMDPQQMHMPGGMPPQGPPPPPAASSAAPSDSAEPSEAKASSSEQGEQQEQQPEVSQSQDGEASSVSDPSSQQAQHTGPSDAHHPQQQQPGVPMHYNMQYYGMYPQQQQQRAYPPQFMPPMGRYPMVGPPMHTPYGYPPMAYPYGYEQGPPPMDDGFRGRGGRNSGGRGGGRGVGRGGRSRGGGGRGQGGRFPPNYNNSGSGRNTPQGEGGAEGSKSPTLSSSEPNPSEGS